MDHTERARAIAQVALRNFGHGAVSHDRLDEVVTAYAAAFREIERETLERTAQYVDDHWDSDWCVTGDEIRKDIARGEKT